ncbi:hypothetical protein AAMO2058_000082700 [Amorphochlora amoebiformis]
MASRRPVAAIAVLLFVAVGAAEKTDKYKLVSRNGGLNESFSLLSVEEKILTNSSLDSRREFFPKLGKLLGGLFGKKKKKKEPEPKPLFKDTREGKLLTSVNPAGDSFPPRHQNYVGSLYARHYVRDKNAQIMAPDKNLSKQPYKPPKHWTDSLQTFNTYFHAIPGRDYDIAKRNAETRAKTSELDIGRVDGMAPLIVSTLMPE